ncbi:MAG TPA: glycogen debranching N-terminal domain-containing protein [Acidimicrobiales bacterium]|nr:glycogen debranching N-terminal domain-containing protein [Acidimicrobiales bacterium]
MTDAWTFTGTPALSGLEGESVTLVEGTSFAISSAEGDIEPGGSQGLFFADTRFVSLWRLRLDDTSPQQLAVVPHEAFGATFLARARPRPGEADSTLFLVRDRFVGNGMREDLVVRNLGREPAACTLSLEVDADFAHLFEVKEGRVRLHGEYTVETSRAMMTFAYEHREVTRRLEVRLPEGAVVTPRLAVVEFVVPARGEWRGCVEMHLEMDGEAVDLRYRCGEAVFGSAPAARLRAWQQKTPRVRTDDDGLAAALDQSARDLGALRIFDPEQPGRAVVAAGAPWFMTLFGRDSLITSYMTLGVDPTLATGTLLTLARFQGKRVDPISEEEPGKILHELRRGLATAAETRKGSIYYGSIDATPLFVMLLGELYRWGLAGDLVRQLLPHADRALAWIDESGDRDGDGFVEYQRATARGLANQGWKDSFDGVSFAGGRLAEPPIALCEVQGYTYAAFLARAQMARGLGDAATARTFEERAATLKAAFNERFWLEDRGYFAMGLDGEKRPIDSLSSNIGHCLWTGIVDADKAARVAERLSGPEMFTGWGIRTLASSMGAYNPASYHNGSVWPHDSAICAAGLARYGFIEEAHAVTMGLLAASESFGGRFPELFCGFDRADFPIPVRYPTSCSPQAWAAATPFLLLRSTLLRLDPSVPEQTVWLAPALPAGIGELAIDNVPLAGGRLSIETDGEEVKVDGLPPGIDLVTSPWPLPGP